MSDILKKLQAGKGEDRRSEREGNDGVEKASKSEGECGARGEL